MIHYYQQVISKLSNNQNGVPYTHHHDYLRNNTERYRKSSRSDVAKREASEEELYACCLAHILNQTNVDSLLKLDEVHSFYALDATRTAKAICKEIDKGSK